MKLKAFDLQSKLQPFYEKPFVKPLCLILSSVFFFFCVSLLIDNNVKLVALGASILSLAAIPLCFKTLRERFHWPMILLFALVVMYGFSIFYSTAPRTAFRDFVIPLAGFSLALLMLCFTMGNAATAGRRIATMLTAAAALASFISIDLISTHIFSDLFQSIMNLVSISYYTMEGVQANARILSIFVNPNTFAGLAGIAILLSLSLATSSEKWYERCIHLIFLYVNAVAFLLSFSMGATALIAAAFLVILFLEKENRRFSLFLLMLETLILSFISVFFISTTSMTVWTEVDPIPLLFTLAGSVALCVIDLLIRRNWTQRIRFRARTLTVSLVAIVGLVCGFLLAAFNLTEPLTVTTGDIISRAIYLSPGDYSMNIDADREFTLTIRSASREQTMMNTYSTVYAGSGEDHISFTVPEDSCIVYVDFRNGNNAQINEVSYSGPKSGTVPLKYTLLPAFIANRMQGLFTNKNAIQRFIYFEDGIKLFLQSPLIGHGLGGFETHVRSVQDSYYETRYAHNHYIELLVGTGIIGFLLFVGLIAVSAICILRCRKREDAHPLLPALGAALVFMAGHALIELTFSAFNFVPFAFAVFALIDLCCGDALPLPQPATVIQIGVSGACCLFLAVFGFLLSCNVYAEHRVKNEYTFEALKTAVRVDPFEWEAYAISYINLSYYNQQDPAVYLQANDYATRLSELNSVSINHIVAQRFFAIGNTDQALTMVVKYVNSAPSDPTVWQNAFDMLQAYYEDTEVYHYYLEKIVGLWKTWNAEHTGTVTLPEITESFLASLGLL